jgi:hypothetical protein
MPIKVNVTSMDKSTLEKIISHYNSNKLPEEDSLEELDRCEGGFQIKISSMKSDVCDANEKIKQLRWSKGYLVSYGGYPTFTEKEEMRLYEALVYALNGNVILEKKLN